MKYESGEKLVFAVPKGRILKELLPIIKDCGIVPESEFSNENSRLLKFSTNIPDLEIIRVRAFDVATFVAYGGAHFGIVGSDVLEEFNYSDLYSPIDLQIGKCRLSVALTDDVLNSPEGSSRSHIRVATKYPNITKKYFAGKGIIADCIKLNGAMEIVPKLGMARRIVDLVSSGSTLKANGMVETEKIMEVSSRLIINRTAMKSEPTEMNKWIDTFRKAVHCIVFTLLYCSFCYNSTL